MINYLKNKDINKKKWDNCIKGAINSIPYAYSWYLDIVCNNWDALILNDYEAVMPLPWKKKFGLKYITHPYYCQQLGLFYTSPKISVDDFLNAIPRKFLYVSINLNISNGRSKYGVKKNTNYELILDDIESVRANYSKNHIKNIKKAKNRGVVISESVDSPFQFSQKKAEVDKDFMNETLLSTESKIINHLLKQSKGQIYSASINGQNCTSVFLIIFDKRLILLTSYSDKLGKRSRAYYLLLDYIFSLPEYQHFVFDFEGSNIKNIANTNAWFGANDKYYYTIRRFFWQF